MATLEFSKEHPMNGEDGKVYALGYVGDEMIACLQMDVDTAWGVYRNLQSVLVGPYSGRNGKYNGN